MSVDYEVIVVGGGVGGLTVAALLAARGVSVCVVERQPHAGGCAAARETHGYTFEGGAGIYPLWGAGEVHQRIFAQLNVPAPRTRLIDPSYTVRLSDATDVVVRPRDDDFFSELSARFPRNIESAHEFYRLTSELGDEALKAASRRPSFAESPTPRRGFRAILPRIAAKTPRRVADAFGRSAADALTAVDARFREFVDAQLLSFVGATSERCSLIAASVALNVVRRGNFAAPGGVGDALTAALVASLKASGATIRYDAAALRLTYAGDGARAAGVTLLSGETLRARRAVVSNLTIWDTYAKLIGADYTPAQKRSEMKTLGGRARYTVLLGVMTEARERLPSDQMIISNAASTDALPLSFSCAPDWDARAPDGKRAAVATFETEAEDWFAFERDEGGHEQLDQVELEQSWAILHQALPELGGNSVEVIETVTPRVTYDAIRRKLGITGAPQILSAPGAHRTFLPNLYLVGDTVFPGQGLAAVSHSALIVADEIAPPKKLFFGGAKVRG